MRDFEICFYNRADQLLARRWYPGMRRGDVVSAAKAMMLDMRARGASHFGVSEV